MMNGLGYLSLLYIISIKDITCTSKFTNDKFEPKFKILVNYDEVLLVIAKFAFITVNTGL